MIVVEIVSMRQAPAANKFVQAVLHKRPKIAVFDCDGTLWSGDAGADFFYYEIERGLIPEKTAKWVLARYEDYKQGKVGEVEMCGEMVQIHDGIPEKDIRAVVREFVASTIAQRTFGVMQELTYCLAESGCELWAVSSTNNWVIEEGVRRFGIPAERILAAQVEVVDGIATDRLIQVPSGDLKAAAIREHIRRPADAVFGNSIHDAAMLEIAKTPFVINPNPDLETIAEDKGWMIFHPNSKE